MWCEGQCLSTLPFIHRTQQGWWTRRSAATSLTSVPGSAQSCREAGQSLAAEHWSQSASVCVRDAAFFRAADTVLCRKVNMLIPSQVTDTRQRWRVLPPFPQHPLHLSPGLLCKTWSPSWEVEKGHYTCKNIPAWQTTAYIEEILNAHFIQKVLSWKWHSLFVLFLRRMSECQAGTKRSIERLCCSLQSKHKPHFHFHTSALLGCHPCRLHACSSGLTTKVLLLWLE